MYGHLKNYRPQNASYGWLNPYFSRTCDGNTELEHITILSNTEIQRLTKDLKLEFFCGEFNVDSFK